MNPSQAYLRNKVETSTPADLVVMLYDGLVRFTRAAAERLRQTHPEARTEAAEAVTRATNILTELNTSLDFRTDPEFCQRLSLLYGFFVEQLTHALKTADAGAIDRVIPMMEELRDAWREAAVNARSEMVQAAG
jgi:flagellar protein FliS